jgi:hypothetical protein
MAIGDTVQAGLMRVDFSPIAKAGEAQARANQAFGDAVGGVINKFYQKKKDKQEREEREQAYLKMGLSDEEAKAASRDKDLANQFINKMNADRNYSLEMEKFNQAGELRDLQVDQIRQNMARQKSADQLAGEERMADNQFMQSLMSQTTSPQAQRQAYIARPGLPALGNADARNRFMQAQLQQPQNQVPVSNLGSQDFGRFAREQGLDPTRSVQRMEALRQAELASQPKAMTPQELADYEAKLIANETNRLKLNDLKNPPAPPAPPEPVYIEAALDAIDDAITLVGKDSIYNPTAGFGSETAKSIGGSDAADLEAALSTITSAVGFKRLQDMREASPTGGALGSVSERELSQLNAALGSISQKQSPEQLKKNLLKIKNHYQKAVDAINAQRIAYNSGLTFKTQEEALKYIQSQKSSNAIKTDQGDYSIEGLSVEAQ